MEMGREPRENIKTSSGLEVEVNSWDFLLENTIQKGRMAMCSQCLGTG